jgi:hypothetical protein
MRQILYLTIMATLAFSQVGCFTIAYKGIDAASEVAAEEESPAQEAQEGPLEHGIEEAGKATQKGIHKIERTKEQAIDKAKEAFN